MADPYSEMLAQMEMLHREAEQLSQHTGQLLQDNQTVCEMAAQLHRLLDARLPTPQIRPVPPNSAAEQR